MQMQVAGDQGTVVISPAQVNTGMVMNTDPAASSPNYAVPHRTGTITVTVLTSISVVLLLIGLCTVSVMDAELSGITIKLSYYGATGRYAGSSASADLDDMSCGSAGLIKFGGALHYLAFFTNIALLVFLGLELAQRVTIGHVTTILLSIINVLIIVQDVVLGAAREKANYLNCSTVLPGLIRYAVGACWLCAIFAQIFTFIAWIVQMCSRVCKCCCYSDPRYVSTTVPVQTVVVGQTQPGNVQQPMYVQPQQQVMYPPTGAVQVNGQVGYAYPPAFSGQPQYQQPGYVQQPGYGDQQPQYGQQPGYGQQPAMAQPAAKSA